MSANMELYEVYSNSIQCMTDMTVMFKEHKISIYRIVSYRSYSYRIFTFSSSVKWIVVTECLQQNSYNVVAFFVLFISITEHVVASKQVFIKV